jgi:hypothetical protein
MTFYSSTGIKEPAFYAQGLGFIWFVIVEIVAVAVLTRYKLKRIASQE